VNHAGRSRAGGLVVAVAIAIAAGCGSNGKAAGAADAGKGDGGAVMLDGPADDGNRDGDAVADLSGHEAAGGPPDASDDASDDALADGRSPRLPFVFTNATGHAIYIQLSGFSGQAYWSLTEAGKRLPVDNTCETCDCSRCSSCAVCGRSLARVKELAPGAQHAWTWDGLIWELVPDGCRASQACEQDQVVPAGAALEVAVTYAASYAVDTSFGADDEFIGPALTATAAFTNAGGAVIEIRATQ
jgi:hypothetical protein